jgi:nitrile hydratase subunit beta
MNIDPESAKRDTFSERSMENPAHNQNATGIVLATHEAPKFQAGETVKVLTRAPIGHYRVPIYLRGKAVLIEAVIEPAYVDNEEEGYGRNAGARGHYYRVAVPMTSVWPAYAGSPLDSLRIEVFETWLERIMA